MKSNRNTLLTFFLGSLATVLAFSGTALAVNVINLTGYWQDDSGNFTQKQAVVSVAHSQGR